MNDTVFRFGEVYFVEVSCYVYLAFVKDRFVDTVISFLRKELCCDIQVFRCDIQKVFLNGCLVVRIYLRRGIRDGNDRTAKGLGIADVYKRQVMGFRTSQMSYGLMVAAMRRTGGYIKAKYSFSNTPSDDFECNDVGMSGEDGEVQWLSLIHI